MLFTPLQLDLTSVRNSPLLPGEISHESTFTGLDSKLNTMLRTTGAEVVVHKTSLNEAVRPQVCHLLYQSGEIMLFVGSGLHLVNGSTDTGDNDLN